jgi:hypothetical protein
MYRFRLLITALIVWLIFVLNIERPDRLLALDSHVSTLIYIFVISIILIDLSIPVLVQVSLEWELLFVGFLFLVLKAVLMQSLTVELINYFTLAELGTVLGTVWLMKHVSYSVWSVENAIPKLFIETVDTQVRNYLHDPESIEEELRRARLYKYPVIMLYLMFKDLKRDQKRSFSWLSTHDLEEEYLKVYIVHLISGLLLEDHHIVYWQNEDLVMCLPETDEMKVTFIVRELHKVISVMMHMNVIIGVARFPKEGVVFSDLLESARSKCLAIASEQQMTGPLSESET